MKYLNELTGKTVEVFQTGKSFKTETTYIATKRVAEETITRKHRCWSGVEKQIKGMVQI